MVAVRVDVHADCAADALTAIIGREARLKLLFARVVVIVTGLVPACSSSRGEKISVTAETRRMSPVRRLLPRLAKLP
jgi:hypothetical protein